MRAHALLESGTVDLNARVILRVLPHRDPIALRLALVDHAVAEAVFDDVGGPVFESHLERQPVRGARAQVAQARLGAMRLGLFSRGDDGILIPRRKVRL